MASAFAWLSDIIGWFGQFIPRVQVVNATEGGVKFKNGKTPVLIEPGLLVWFPFTTELKLYPSVLQSIDLKAQTISTADNKTIVVGGIVEYQVVDMLTLITSTWDADTIIRNIAAATFSDVLKKRTWQQLQNLSAQNLLEREVRRELRKKLRKLGVKVTLTTFTDFAVAKVYKLIQSTSQDGF